MKAAWNTGFATLIIAIAVPASAANATPRLQGPRASTTGAGTQLSTGGDLEVLASVGTINAGSLSGGSLELVGGLILPILPTDCDEDGSVGYLDHDNLVHCLAGPDVIVTPECHCFDVDASGSADLRDFAALQQHFNIASRVPGDPR